MIAISEGHHSKQRGNFIEKKKTHWNVLERARIPFRSAWSDALKRDPLIDYTNVSCSKRISPMSTSQKANAQWHPISVVLLTITRRDRLRFGLSGREQTAISIRKQSDVFLFAVFVASAVSNAHFICIRTRYTLDVGLSILQGLLSLNVNFNSTDYTLTRREVNENMFI